MTYIARWFSRLSSRKLQRATLSAFAILEAFAHGQVTPLHNVGTANTARSSAFSVVSARAQNPAASEAYIDFLLALRSAEDGSRPEALRGLAESLRLQSKENPASGLAFQLLTEQRANSRLILRGHTAAITYAAFSPDGSKIVTASLDHTARIWDAHSGRQLGPSLQNTGSVLMAEFNPDGKRVVTGCSDGTATVWDIESAHPIGTPMHAKESIRFVRFSPNGKLVATASKDGKVRFWHSETGEPVAKEVGYRDDVFSVNFSPDSSHAVTATGDNIAEILDTKTGARLPNPMRQNNLVVGAVFSREGNTVLTASVDHTAKIWDAETHLPTGTNFTHGYSVESAVFNFDSSRVLTSSLDHTARVWDAKTGKPITPPLQHAAGVVRGAFSPDGSFVVTISLDRTTRVWDASSGEPLYLPIRTSTLPTSVAFSPVGSSLLVAEGNTVQLFDLPPSEAAPAWVADLADYASTQTNYNAQIPDHEKIKKVRLQLLASKATDPWSIFGRWYFTESTVRQLSPWNTITLKHYVDYLIEAGDQESLRYASELSRDHPDWMVRVAAARNGFASHQPASLAPPVSVAGGSGTQP
jgi:WD40 repeat protein